MAGHDGMCVLHDGKPYCWGPSGLSIIGQQATEIDIPKATGLSHLPVGTLRQIARNWAFACALIETPTSGDKVYCWGDDDCLLGRGICTGATVPVEAATAVTGLPSGQAISELTLAEEHACVLTQGAIYCWGKNSYGELGSLDATGLSAAQIPGIPGDAKRIRALHHGACAIYSDKEPYCWGKIFDSIDLGPNPTALTSALGVEDLTVGLNHLCALSQRGEITCWNSGTPETMTLPPGPKVVALSEALSTATSLCFIREGGSVWCWGDNTSHQCGMPNATEGGADSFASDQAQEISLPLPATELANHGESTFCARLTDGDVYCWGSNWRTVLGRDNTYQSFSSPIPRKIEGLDPLYFTDGQPASFVIGQSDFVSKIEDNQHLRAPWHALSLLGDDLFLPDDMRGFVFPKFPAFLTQAGGIDLGSLQTLGQVDVTSDPTIPHPFLGSIPRIQTFESTYYILDSGFPGISLWNSLPLGERTYGSASNIGMITPDAVDLIHDFMIAGGKLVALDAEKIMIWNHVPTASTTTGTADIRILGPGNSLTPWGPDCALQPRFWTDGRMLMVGDSCGRVVIWTEFPTTDETLAPAALMLSRDNRDCTPGCTAAANAVAQNIGGIASNGMQIFVADPYNSRILVWDSIPSVNGVDADHVLGQVDFTSAFCNRTDVADPATTLPGPATLCEPWGITYADHRLFVSDARNFRIVVYTSQPAR